MECIPVAARIPAPPVAVHDGRVGVTGGPRLSAWRQGMAVDANVRLALKSLVSQEAAGGESSDSRPASRRGRIRPNAPPALF
jgi:hypothetical protein